MKNRLKVLRAERDWTQADLADTAGVARQTIVALENEKYSPSLELAYRFSRIFGKTIEEIFIPPEDGDREAQ
jgi:putative transcriptional regulator